MPVMVTSRFSNCPAVRSCAGEEAMLHEELDGRTEALKELDAGIVVGFAHPAPVLVAKTARNLVVTVGDKEEETGLHETGYLVAMCTKAVLIFFLFRSLASWLFRFCCLCLCVMDVLLRQPVQREQSMKDRAWLQSRCYLLCKFPDFLRVQLKQDRKSSSSAQWSSPVSSRGRGPTVSSFLAAVCVCTCTLLPLVSAGCPMQSSSGSRQFGSTGQVDSCFCNVGFSGPDGGPCIPCGLGFYQDSAGSTSCKKCPPNTFSSAPGSVKCTECSTGSFAEPCSTACTQCPLMPSNSVFQMRNGCEWACRGGFYLSSSKCLPCPDHLSAPLGSTSPANCSDVAIFLSPFDNWKAAIESALDGSTIVLSRGRYSGACNLAVSRDIDLYSSDGKFETVLDCNNASRHFHIDGARVNIQGVTFANGKADNQQRTGMPPDLEGGGCLLVTGDAHVAIRDSVFTGCSTSTSGGAIFATASWVELSRVEIFGCSAKRHGGGVFIGNGGKLNVRHALIRDNEAGESGGGVFAIFFTVVLSRVEVVRCTATNSGGGVELLSSYADLSDSSIVDNTAETGGGVFCGWSSQIYMNSVVVAGCIASGNGGGLVLDSRSTLHAWELVMSRNKAGNGGGAISTSFSTVNLFRGHLEANTAGHLGGAIGAEESEVKVQHISTCSNHAISGGGAVALVNSRMYITGHSLFYQDTSRDSGGGLYLTGHSSLAARDCTFEECEATNNGGAIALYQESSANLSGVTLFARNSAEYGGAIYAQGSALEFSGGELTIRGNTAMYLGGGILAWSPVKLTNGNAIISGNRASTGGGWCSIGHKAQLSVALDFRLLIADCYAEGDGGGMAMLDRATLVIDVGDTCPDTCQEKKCKLALDVSESCMTAKCNFHNGACNVRFEAAGQAASQPCNRRECPIYHEKSPTECANLNHECMTAQCDWAEANPHCRATLSLLGECPLYDAVAYHSITQQTGLTYVTEEGGTAGGFGRCNRSGCHAMTDTNASIMSRWCEVMDDGGRIQIQTSNPAAYEDGGQAWGICSDKTHPRLPSSGFNYNASAMRVIANMDIDVVLRQYPGCGSNPLRLVSNTAEGRGGGLFHSENSDAAQNSVGKCFLGDIELGSEPALMLLFENNTAAAGGGVFSENSGIEACKALMEKELGLPSAFNNRRHHILEFRANSASHYGADIATAPNKIEVYDHQAGGYVPGSDILNFTVQLFDSLDQLIDASVSPYFLKAHVCVGNGNCTPYSSLQPTLFTRHVGEVSCTADHNIILQHCQAAASAVHVRLSVTKTESGDNPDSEWIDEWFQSPSVTIGVECLPCRAGQALKHTQTSDAGTLWTCDKCLPDQYILSPESGCQQCPVGGICNGSSFVEALPGSVWIPKMESGGTVMWLVSCPPGHAVLYDDGYASFSPERQQCVECFAGEECIEEKCDSCSPCRPGHYKAADGTAACHECPEDTYSEISGGLNITDCRSCPALSSTRGARGMDSIDACECMEGCLGHRAGKSLACHKCPDGPLKICISQWVLARSQTGDAVTKFGNRDWRQEVQTRLTNQFPPEDEQRARWTSKIRIKNRDIRYSSESQDPSFTSPVSSSSSGSSFLSSSFISSPLSSLNPPPSSPLHASASTATPYLLLPRSGASKVDDMDSWTSLPWKPFAVIIVVVEHWQVTLASVRVPIHGPFKFGATFAQLMSNLRVMPPDLQLVMPDGQPANE